MAAEQIIRDLLRIQLNTISGSFPTVYENMPYTPTIGTPWQWAILLWAQTENPTMGDDFQREVGIFQVGLSFPRSQGPDALNVQSAIIRGGFKRGLTLSQANVKMRVLHSPYLSPAFPSDGAWYQVAVSVPFVADVQPV